MGTTGDRCNDLYELSKTLHQFKWRNDKSKDDYEYEKSKDECTFAPNLVRISGQDKLKEHLLKQKKNSL
jgi:hypothetical protein